MLAGGEVGAAANLMLRSALYALFQDTARDRSQLGAGD